MTCHLLVAEAQYAATLFHQQRISQRILLSSLSMKVSIDFDDQLMLRAVEINDGAANGVLAAEFDPCQPAVSQGMPKNSFARREVAP